MLAAAQPPRYDATCVYLYVYRCVQGTSWPAFWLVLLLLLLWAWVSSSAASTHKQIETWSLTG
jgi:hypothetical protein